jgi:hypothetical protein
MIPMLALIYFLQGVVRAEWDRKQVTTQVYRNFQEVEKISNLIHELQKERALTIAFLRNGARGDESRRNRS